MKMKSRHFYPFIHSADNYQEKETPNLPKTMAFILGKRAYKFKTGRWGICLRKITEFIHFLATEKLDEVTLKN